MKHSMLTTWCARVALALIPLGVYAPAHAATTYNFTFGTAASGFFVTNGAAADPGYELITSMTFDFVTTNDLVVHTGPFTTVSFQPGAAYAPTTGGFLNHYSGSTYEDFGGAFLSGATGSLMIVSTSFSQYGGLDGYFNGSYGPLRSASLNVAPCVPDTSAIPEPATLVLLGIGLLGAVASRRRTRRS